MVRKTALAKTFKLKKGIKVDADSYLKTLSLLKICYPYNHWWSWRDFTKNSIYPFHAIKPVFSYASLNSYLECPYKYKLKNYIGLREERSLSLVIGSAYHEIMKNFFKEGNGDFSWERLAGIINKVFKEIEFEFEFLRKATIIKALGDFKRYFDSCFPFSALKILTEKKFRFELDGNGVAGRVDQINFLEGDIIEIVDFKSGLKKITDSFLENEIQLRLYRLAVDLSPEMKFLRNYKSILKYIFLGDEGEQVYKLSDEFYDYEDTINFLRSLIGDIKNEKFEAEPQSSYLCVDCDFKIVCPNKNTG